MRLEKLRLLLLILVISHSALASDKDSVIQILLSGRSNCSKANSIYNNLQNIVIENLSPSIYRPSYFEVTGVTQRGEHFLLELTAASFCSTGSRGPHGCSMQYQCHVYQR